MSQEDKIKEAAIRQTAGLGAGAAFGAITGNPIRSALGPRCPNTAIQIGSAITSAARAGASVGGSLAAGAAVVTGKAAAIYAATTTVAVAAAPIAAVGAIGYGLYRLLKSD
ncbi:MAG: hypothetical protein KDC98_05985 [Planctomycetes bacterium]|nr:hypothetical protein [Planctomycetota bacterium]